jgi:hypothetical protein
VAPPVRVTLALPSITPTDLFLSITLAAKDASSKSVFCAKQKNGENRRRIVTKRIEGTKSLVCFMAVSLETDFYWQ